MSTSVLFICTHNSARSQMAEGLLRSAVPGVEVLSAGTEPRGVNPFAIDAMTKFGIDISDHTSDHIDIFLNKKIDFVVTVCDSAKENCPFVPAFRKNLHKSFPDPSATTGSDVERLNSFVTVRDLIKDWLRTDIIPLLENVENGLPENL